MINTPNSNITDMLDMGNGLTQYKETWQYTTWRTTHKSPRKDENGKPIKDNPNDLSALSVVCQSAYSDKFAVGVKEFTFEELVEATKQGHSLKRIGLNVQGTRFLVIDIDNDGNEDITPEELDSFCTDRIRWTPGGSGRQYRYHLFVFLTVPIVTAKEFKDQSERILKQLAEHIGRFDKIAVDEHQYSYLQWCYGVPQEHLEHMEEEELPGTFYRCRQIRKNNNYQIVKVDPNAPKEEKTPEKSDEKEETKPLMPYNSAMLASMLNEDQLFAKRLPDGSYVNPKVCLEGKRFDIIEPRMKKQAVKKGKRFSTAQAWIYRLVPQYFRCKSYGLEYSEDDLIYTFYTLCKRNFMDFKPWWKETGENMLNSLKNELHSNDDLDYPEIENKYRSSHTKDLYKRYGYNLATVMDIVDNYASVSKKDSTATFSSKADLEKILKEYRVSYQSFMRYMPLLDLKVAYRSDNRKGCKFDFIHSALVCGTFFYTHYNEAHRQYCKRNGIPYVNMFKIFSGTKEEYKKTVAATDDAIKDMHKFFAQCEQSPQLPTTQKKEKKDEEEGVDDDLPF